MYTMIKKTGKAYIAGLIDGEGCITVLKRKLRKRGLEYTLYEPHVIIAMTDRGPLDFVRKIYPGMLTSHSPKNPEYRRQYRYAATRPSVKRMVRELEPYLINKKEQAKLMQRFPTSLKGLPRSTQEEIYQRHIYEELKRLKGNKENMNNFDSDSLNEEMQLPLL